MLPTPPPFPPLPPLPPLPPFSPLLGFLLPVNLPPKNFANAAKPAYKNSAQTTARGERPDPYLKSLLANQMIPHDKECELALAITFAKENWWYFATWPKDVKKFAELERDKRRREWEQRQREWEQRHWEWIEKWERERGG
ncbi:hypothetical protein J3E72DRAFT_373702 [Bipolaris maydis]|nr:hypothetical protein BM1_02333 [Bipolaris maydis]KAJ6199246.1 hypothetical protein J3E72DRAFT_373702 [Bipolaris maydis]